MVNQFIVQKFMYKMLNIYITKAITNQQPRIFNTK